MLQNAIDFSSPGERIRIEITANKDEVTTAITDEGTGIPSYALNRILDRFYSLPRLGQERKSSVLGLCFVRESDALRGGTLTIRNRTSQNGTKATIRFPRKRP